jgi:hypothetical protein
MTGLRVLAVAKDEDEQQLRAGDTAAAYRSEYPPSVRRSPERTALPLRCCGAIAQPLIRTR